MAQRPTATSVEIDEAFHYPPELLEILVEAIALLFKSKESVILFFRGAGLKGGAIEGWERRVRGDRESVKKVGITRDLLARVNALGDGGIRLRREILRRVYEREDFSTCWPEQEDRARVLVTRVRQIRDQRDAFTRIHQEYERERSARVGIQRAEAEERQRLESEREAIKRDLFTLFGETDRQRRGKALESVLNRLFESYGMSVRRSFTITGDEGEGIVEQIDGVVEIDGELYFVEMKWWGRPVGKPEIAEHLVRIYHRAEARAIIISESGFTTPAMAECKQALQHRVCILCGLDEIVRVLEDRRDLRDLVRRKVRAAMIEREPYFRVP
jgi:restriction endonuclease Mrr